MFFLAVTADMAKATNSLRLISAAAARNAAALAAPRCNSIAAATHGQHPPEAPFFVPHSHMRLQRRWDPARWTRIVDWQAALGACAQCQSFLQCCILLSDIQWYAFMGCEVDPILVDCCLAKADPSLCAYTQRGADSWVRQVSFSCVSAPIPPF